MIRSYLMTIAVVFAAAIALLPKLSADETPLRGFATVNLFFINQFLPDPLVEAVASGGRGGLSSRAPELQFETSRIFLNGEYVGDAMFRHIDVMPRFNLTPGKHTFRIECDGYKDFERTLTVLQNGSVQWLVVKFDRMHATAVAPLKNPAKE